MGANYGQFQAPDSKPKGGTLGHLNAAPHKDAALYDDYLALQQGQSIRDLHPEMNEQDLAAHCTKLAKFLKHEL